jgi:malate dehydrogenase (oxaloacetate-decarboxylating)(NADP+)
MSDRDKALRYHEDGRPGKVEVVPSVPLTTQRHLSLAYSPGVAWPCRAIADDPDQVFRYTAKGNLVAVVTNGSAVLGLGNIGALAGKPVMEGKGNLFKKFADIDVFDIELDATTADEMVAAVKAIAPTFGGINLEDIAAPECFEVERRLQDELDIPVFHDDQHGTAIISAAALLNACELTGREMSDLTLVFSGAGAAAIACAELYVSLGVKRENIRLYDSKGLVHQDRDNLFANKAAFAVPDDGKDLAAALEGADVFIGLSIGDLLSPDDIRKMAEQPIIFAMANPDPEIPYDVAKEARPDAIMATGRSDFPNQVNNVLGFPFVFRGALDCRARKINQEMKMAATRALAALARQDVPDNVLRAYGVSQLRFGPDYIIPKPFDPRVLTWVAPAVARAAVESGVARTAIEDFDAYRERLHQLVERSRGLMQPLLTRAKNSPAKRLAFPDGTDPQVLRAAQILVDEGICTPVLLGPPERIRMKAEAAGVSLDGMELTAVDGSPHFDALAEQLWKSRQRHGMTYSSARVKLRDRTWFAAMMLREGLADGMVGGVHRPYAATMSPALKVLGTEPEISRVSGVYAMLFSDRKLFFGDCTVNVDPDAETLAQIAYNTAKVAEAFGVAPRVAMLSYSDFGEHYADPDVAKVRRAVEIVRERWPDLEVDGEMQADTAVGGTKLDQDFPFCALSGPANVLVFPDLQSGNIAYKLLVKLAAAEVLGPLVAGIGRPASVIPVGATVTDIVNISTWTVVQALEKPTGP